MRSRRERPQVFLAGQICVHLALIASRVPLLLLLLTFEDSVAASGLSLAQLEAQDRAVLAQLEAQDRAQLQDELLARALQRHDDDGASCNHDDSSGHDPSPSCPSSSTTAAGCPVQLSPRSCMNYVNATTQAAAAMACVVLLEGCSTESCAFVGMAASRLQGLGFDRCAFTSANLGSTLRELAIFRQPRLIGLPEGGLLSSLTGLRSLAIHDCPALRTLPPDLLASLSRLTSLQLHDLPSLSGRLPPLLETAASLEELWLQGNNLGSLALSSGYLRPPPDRSRLRHLTLNKNRISRLAGDAFHGLGALEVLWLTDNKLESLPSAHVFDSLTSLRELHLSKNALTQIPAGGVFRKTTELRSLWLTHNQLGPTLPEDMLEGLRELRILYLNSNRLRKLPSGFFHYELPNLEHIYLSENPELEPDVFLHSRFSHHHHHQQQQQQQQYPSSGSSNALSPFSRPRMPKLQKLKLPAHHFDRGVTRERLGIDENVLLLYE